MCHFAGPQAPDLRRCSPNFAESSEWHESGGVLVVSADGHVYGRAGGGWQQLGDATDVVVPGY